MEKSKEKEEISKPIVARTPVELQRLKLEKLMKNPDKPILLPDKPKERGAPVIPDFVRNVMGSSAGAGSGEFHVYRHLRRKEYARQHYMNEKARWEKLETEYHEKLEDNKRKSEEGTAKKRAKRLKKLKNKQKMRGNKKNAKNQPESSSSSSESESEDENSKNNDSDKETKDDVKCNDNNGLVIDLEENSEAKREEITEKDKENAQIDNSNVNISDNKEITNDN